MVCTVSCMLKGRIFFGFIAYFLFALYKKNYTCTNYRVAFSLEDGGISICFLFRLLYGVSILIKTTFSFFVLYFFKYDYNYSTMIPALVGWGNI